MEQLPIQQKLDNAKQWLSEVDEILCAGLSLLRSDIDVPLSLRKKVEVANDKIRAASKAAEDYIAILEYRMAEKNR